jgi:putative nucleotidyltransferase with HDIG domain
MSGKIHYRVRQFWRAMCDSATPEELSHVQTVLSPPLFALFCQMLPFEQAHAIRVYQRVCEQGYTDPDLLAAALLHDVGKARVHLRPWERALYVLGEALLPELADQWGDREPKGPLRGFVVREQHAAWGAEMAAEAGASERLLRLIAHHQGEISADLLKEEQTLLAVLQKADDVN